VRRDLLPVKLIPRDKWPRPLRFKGHWCYQFWEPTFRVDVHLIWPVNEEQRKAYIRERLHTDDAGELSTAWFGCVSDVGPMNVQVLSLRKWKNDSNGNGKLVHETFHVANNILRSRGVLFSNDSAADNEAYSYLTQSLFETFHQALMLARPIMPLRKGKRAKTKKGFSANVKTLVDDFKRKGKIGTSKPRSKKAAVKQALAISFALKRGGRKRGSRRVTRTSE
jgi:hypothetical protein